MRVRCMSMMHVGGALAKLASLSILEDAALGLRKDQVECYAVAAPRVGNKAWAQAFRSHVPHTWNVINDQVRAETLPVMPECQLQTECQERVSKETF